MSVEEKNGRKVGKGKKGREGRKGGRKEGRKEGGKEGKVGLRGQ